MSEVKDFRGTVLNVGDKVVVSGLGSRLFEKTIKAFERPGKPAWWVNVRFEGGSITTPDRCALLESTPQIDLEIKKLDVRDGDVLLLRTDARVNEEQLEKLAEAWDKAVTDLSHARTIFLAGGLELERLTEEQLAELGLQSIPEPDRCLRCGGPYGGVSHGPGACIDFLEELSEEELRIVERLADGEDPYTVDPQYGCTNPLTGAFPNYEVELLKKRRSEGG